MILFLTNRIFFQHHHIDTYRLQIKIQVKKTFNFVIGGGWVQNRMPDLNCMYFGGTEMKLWKAYGA